MNNENKGGYNPHPPPQPIIILNFKSIYKGLKW